MIKTSFPALESIFSFHPTSVLPIFSLISLNAFFLFLPTWDGKPRYFPCCLMTCVPNLPFISSWISLRVLRLKNRDILALFSCCLKTFSYAYTTPCKASHSAIDALQKMRLSSAKNKMGELWSTTTNTNPLHSSIAYRGFNHC